MNTDVLLLLCGIFNFGFAVFHMFFWKVFRWKADLRSLGPANRGIMQVMNLGLIYIFFCLGAATIYYKSVLITTDLGKTVLLFISVFWLIRAAEQLIFFDIKSNFSRILFVIFVAGSLLHLYPLII
jgi:hypothetical protein